MHRLLIQVPTSIKDFPIPLAIESLYAYQNLINSWNGLKRILAEEKKKAPVSIHGIGVGCKKSFQTSTPTTMNLDTTTNNLDRLVHLMSNFKFFSKGSLINSTEYLVATNTVIELVVEILWSFIEFEEGRNILVKV